MSKVDKPGETGPDYGREDLGLVVRGKNSESCQIDRGLVAMFLWKKRCDNWRRSLDLMNHCPNRRILN